MKNFFCLLLLSLLLFSCTADPKPDDAIGTAEAAYADSPTAQNLNALTTAYAAHLDSLPDSPQRAEYRLKLADLQVKGNRYTDALQNYKTLIINDFDKPQAAEATLGLADLYGNKLKNEMGAAAVYEGFVTSFPNHPKAAEIKAQVAADSMNMQAMIKDLGGRVYSDKTNRIDTKVATDFINIAEIHAMLLPNDSQSPVYLHDAGRTAGYMRSFLKAIEMYRRVVEKYPENDQSANSTFMLGYTYDNDLKDYGEARKYYEMFLSKYPAHELAASAKVLLENLGVPDDEIIERLQQNQQG